MAMNGEKPFVEKCAECKFYQQKGNQPGQGACRRFPPDVNLIIQPPQPPFNQPGIMIKSDFPPVMTGEWCGEFIRKLVA